MTEFLNSLSEQGIFLLRVFIAGILGLILGIERTRRQKEAGIRTHFIVGTAAALMMTVSLSFENDSARIAAQIVTGIGFLGAGMIFFRRESLHGLTTAAGIWATAGIGMACGAGLYLLAVGATLIIFIAMTIFHSRIMYSHDARHMFLVKFDYSEEAKKMLQTEFQVEKFSRFKIYISDGKNMA
ncbi:MAG TPA: MgtC/SapB family protein, partial [Clostridia bacterium]|nr:MgtC/SapB family protein [Clostridia bacterium]